MPLIPLLLILLVATEIALFMVVGDAIGTLPTLLLVIATSILGWLLLQIFGFAALLQQMRMFAEGRITAAELMAGGLVMIALALLILPGFLSDAVGLVILLTNIRRLLGRGSSQPHATGNGTAPGWTQGETGREGGGAAGPTTIEGEFQREDRQERPRQR